MAPNRDIKNSDIKEENKQENDIRRFIEEENDTLKAALKVSAKEI